jgi:predicted secreted Zn-dependent protease
MSFFDSSGSLRPTKLATYRRSARLLFEVSLLFILGVTGIATYISTHYTDVAIADTKSTATFHPSQKATAPAPAAVSNAPKTTPIVVPAAQAPLCTPDSSYQLPSAMTLSQPGLSQVIDTPSTYVVYGTNAEQIMTEISHCTPVHTTSGKVGDYAASTADYINWQFSYDANDDGLCSLDNVAVGLHVNQIFPSWQPSGSSSLGSDWQEYIAKLYAYENGHVLIDEQTANQVLDDLQNFPPTDCDAIVQAATAIAVSDTNNGNQANANYDTNNDYGLNEGVIL